MNEILSESEAEKFFQEELIFAARLAFPRGKMKARLHEIKKHFGIFPGTRSELRILAIQSVGEIIQAPETVGISEEEVYTRTPRLTITFTMNSFDEDLKDLDPRFMAQA